ncbi:hypothetical protein SEA_CAMBIARE_54 [Mycobacterium phage Cambiare]|uniref:Uncharacterized protein n=1 Tax=Mycobacterium phage Cambiare TaxID=1647305 RepID=A0A0F6WED1_9CAUD|nr:hypothetical protein AVT48_gp54 [Mycobacterium phage Cambiare]AKF14556.1 hypothetical protein SEA_CAMBIARE_54 [Mycobacterium phage Cambiare]
MARVSCLECNCTAKKCDSTGYGRKCCPDCNHPDAMKLVGEHFAKAINASRLADAEPSAHGSRAWSAAGELHMRIAEFAMAFEVQAAPFAPITVPPAGDQ